MGRKLETTKCNQPSVINNALKEPACAHIFIVGSDNSYIPCAVVSCTLSLIACALPACCIIVPCYVPRTVASASHACLHVITARSCSCYTACALAFLHPELDCMHITYTLHHCAMCCSICIACVTAGVHRARLQLLHLVRFAIVHPKPDAFTS